jgi:hypothetical protein
VNCGVIVKRKVTFGKHENPEHEISELKNEMLRFEICLKEDVFWKRKEREEDDAKAKQMISLTSGSRNNN